MCLLDFVGFTKVTVLTACALIFKASTQSVAEMAFASDTETKWSEVVVATHNSPRVRVGLPAFQWNDELAGIAREWLKSDTMSAQCTSSTVVHSSKEFRTRHPASPFYYLGETAVSKELPAQVESWDALQLAQQAIGRWGVPMAQNVTYGRWGSACTVEKFSIATDQEDQRLGIALAVAEGFFQSLWAETREVGCEAAFCGFNNNQNDGNENWKTFLLICEYGPGGNVIGELPFSPTTASMLGLSSSPCDGPLSDSEWLHWERWDGKNYPLPVGQAAINGATAWHWSTQAMVFVFLVHANK